MKLGHLCKQVIIPEYKSFLEQKESLLQQGIDLFDFSLGNPDRPTPDLIVVGLVDAVQNPKMHRYVTPFQGLNQLRQAIANWYQKRFQVSLDFKSEVIATQGAKQALTLLALALMDGAATALVPTPSYSMHQQAFLLAGGHVETFQVQSPPEMLGEIEAKLSQNNHIRVVLLNFPSNPSGQCVDVDFFEQVISLAKRHKVWVIHDFAYADICFDGYHAPSILQVPGAKDIAIEVCSMSKSYNMTGWRIGYVAGQAELINALFYIKSHFDYGLFGPIQLAAREALHHSEKLTQTVCNTYQKRRDIFCHELKNMGWDVSPPPATMFVWAPIPDKFRSLNSISFSRLLLEEAHIVVSPGIGFGQTGDRFVRFALIENDARMVQAIENMRVFFSQSHQFSI